jgi:WD40 repeat protein
MLAAAVRPWIAALTAPGGAVDSVASSPDGKTLATGNADGTVRLRDVATHRQIAALTGPTGAVTSVAFSRNGETLATGSADHTVRLRDVAYLVNVVPHLCAPAGRSLTRWTAPGILEALGRLTRRVATIRARPGYQSVCP